MPELQPNESTRNGYPPSAINPPNPAVRRAPETELAEAIAEYCRLTAATIADIRYLRRAIEPPNVETCTYQMQVAQGGTGEWDNVYPCRELGTVCNLADARDADTPGALYCARHQQQRDKERARAALSHQASAVSA